MMQPRLQRTQDGEARMPAMPPPRIAALFAMLQSAGIEVKDDLGRSAFMHNKFWIFDGQVVWTGSTNITKNGIYDQNNNVIVIRLPESG